MSTPLREGYMYYFASLAFDSIQRWNLFRLDLADKDNCRFILTNCEIIYYRIQSSYKNPESNKDFVADSSFFTSY
jgi:hypothetical protein